MGRPRLRPAAAGPAAFPGAPDQLAAWHGRRGGRTASATGGPDWPVGGRWWLPERRGVGRPPGPGAGPAGVGRQRPWPRGAGESVRSRRTRATVQALWGPSVSHEPSWTPELDSRAGLDSTRLDSRLMGRARVWWLRSTRRRTVSRV